MQLFSQWALFAGEKGPKNYWGIFLLPVKALESLHQTTNFHQQISSKPVGPKKILSFIETNTSVFSCIGDGVIWCGSPNGQSLACVTNRPKIYVPDFVLYSKIDLRVLIVMYGGRGMFWVSRASLRKNFTSWSTFKSSSA